jgi:hypothetical protein
VKKHFFVFEDRKTAIVYFFNEETCDFIGPLYDSGPRFKIDECVKRYALFEKEAVIVESGQVPRSEWKETPEH